MKNLLCILLLSVSFVSTSQLYVSDNSFIYNKGRLIYVKGKIELNGASHLYLRNNGQLIQGTTSASVNTGTGKLSVFQEGTVNNFCYNYWCSPVGNASTNSGNEDFGITMLNVPISKTMSNPATMNSGLNGVSGTGSLSIASYWIWKFLSSSSYSQWFHSGANTNISAGQGFTMKGTSGFDLTDVGETAVNNFGNAQRYDFRGKPNDGNITVNVAANGFTLTGNPYPSALHVNAFLLDEANSACDGVAYYWEQDKTVNSHVLSEYQGGYGTYSPISLESDGVYVPATYNTYNVDGTLNNAGASSGLSVERKYAPIGQGFMVKGVFDGNLTLKNEYRVYKKEGDYSQFQRQMGNLTTETNEVIGIPQIHINTIMNNQYTSQIALAFVPMATDGVDVGIDAKSPVDNNVPNDVYFFLNNEKFVIQGVAFDVDKRISLGVKSTNNATFKFDASQVLNVDETQPIYLYDAQDESYHEIRNNIYELVLPTGIYNNRFEITFKDNSLNNNNNDIKSDVGVFQNNSAQMLIISNPNSIALRSLSFYDLSGKLIFNKENLDSRENYQFSTSGLSNGVYLIEVTASDERRMVQKVMITSL
ncbi:T9SS type A sorting domain-containing protein [Flavobacterium sp. UBA7682]|uniref:T9SS type A sorting domain-containing protein n=1 Tax=Flavobacterium sp. UBA7682 TaxID=1946560 RepID=UPI0025B8D990|nr:T9SS type A sorting domain-containing protein [Flavobacterium sp. UBA7682]